MKKSITTYSFLFFCFASFSSQLHAQCEINVDIMDLFCTTDSTYTLRIGLNTSNLPGDSVEVSINNTMVGQFKTDAFPLTFTDVVHSGGINDSISVCAVGDNLCCGVMTYESPTSYCADCANYFVMGDFSCDTDSTVEFTLKPFVEFPIQMAPAGNLYVEIDNFNIYEIEYTIGSIYTISGVELTEGPFHSVFWTFIEPDCSLSLDIIASPDCEALCTIDTIEVQEFICTSDTTYDMVVDAALVVPNELYFLPVEVSINGAYHGVYDQGSLTYIIENIPTSDDGTSTLEICVTGTPDGCCKMIGYDEPNCGSNSVSETNAAQEILIYPNPAMDLIQVENMGGALNVYNLSGDLLIHKKKIDQYIDIGSLSPGIYYLEVVGEFITYGKFVKQ